MYEHPGPAPTGPAAEPGQRAGPESGAREPGEWGEVVEPHALHYGPSVRALASLLPWLWPGGLLVAADLLLLWLLPDASWLTVGVGRYFGVALLVGALLAWVFQRSRVLAMLIVLGGLAVAGSVAVAGASVAGEAGPQPAAPGAWEAVGAMALLLVGVASVVKDRGVASGRGLAQVAGAGALVWLAAWISVARPDAWGWLASGRVLEGVGPARAPALLWLWLAAAVTAGAMSWRREHPAERALAWVTLLIILAVAAGPGTVAADTHLFTGALVLGFSVVETSYRLAYRDELTGLPSRRALWQALDGAGPEYSVAMIDVDHFKRFNDRHGHDVGDQVLRLVAERLREVTGGGRAFRYGGEEFTVVFAGKNLDEALPHLEALRAAVEESRFAVRRPGRPREKPRSQGTKGRREPRKLSVTVSIGAARRRDRAPEAVVKAADRALYRAKKAGRNRVAK